MIRILEVFFTNIFEYAKDEGKFGGFPRYTDVDDKTGKLCEVPGGQDLHVCTPPKSPPA